MTQRTGDLSADNSVNAVTCWPLRIATVFAIVGVALGAVIFEVEIPSYSQSYSRAPDPVHQRTVPDNDHGTTVYITPARAFWTDVMMWTWPPSIILLALIVMRKKSELDEEDQ